MKPAGTQLAMVVDDPTEVAREREREIEDQRALLERFFAACRDVIRDSTGDKVANELEALWGDLGRHVSSGVLKQTLAQGEVFNRNYFRVEWLIWFARESEEVADIVAEMIGLGLPTKDPKEELRDLQEIVRSHYPKDAEKHIRKAKQKKR